MKHILVIVDMQNDFVDGALGTPEARAIVEPVVELIRQGGYDRVFATRDTHGPEYLSTQEGKQLPVPHCIKGTPGWELVPAVAAALKDARAVLVDKPTFGSFDLSVRVRAACGDDEARITVAGLCTDICVVTNALLLKTALPEADLRVVTAACAGVTPESHAAALRTMEACQIRLV